MEKVKLMGKLCHLVFGHYPNNTIGIEAILASNGDLWCVPTINWEQYFEGPNYKEQFKFPRLCIDKRNQNKNVYEELIEAGVITKVFISLVRTAKYRQQGSRKSGRKSPKNNLTKIEKTINASTTNQPPLHTKCKGI